MIFRPHHGADVSTQGPGVEFSGPAGKKTRNYINLHSFNFLTWKISAAFYRDHIICSSLMKHWQELIMSPLLKDSAKKQGRLCLNHFHESNRHSSTLFSSPPSIKAILREMDSPGSSTLLLMTQLHRALI